VGQNHKKEMEQEKEDNVKGMQAVLGAAAEEGDGAGEGHEGVIVEVVAAAAARHDDTGIVA